jgi:peptidoglycan/xylan/chitin deacetylase (PgdA/CDA1 family)
VTRDLRRAVLLSFDNLGEAADVERETNGALSGDHPSVTVALPWLLGTLAELRLRATFFVEALNAELYPDAVRGIAAAGHEVGLHGWRHERWDTLGATEEDELLGRGMRAFASLRVDVQGFRPPGGAMGPRTLAALAEHGLSWCSPAGTHARRTGAITLLPFRWALVDAYHRMDSFADRRVRLGDRPRSASPREAADAIIEELDAPADGPVVLILHPFLMLKPAEVAEARRVLARVAALVEDGERWVAPGRELAALLGGQLSPRAA